MSDTPPDDCVPPEGTTQIGMARRHQRAQEPLCQACADAWAVKNAADWERNKDRIKARRAELRAERRQS